MQSGDTGDSPKESDQAGPDDAVAAVVSLVSPVFAMVVATATLLFPLAPFLHARNWRAMGFDERARACNRWGWALAVLEAPVFTQSETYVRVIGASLICLTIGYFLWIFAHGLAQMRAAGPLFQAGTARRRWATPLLAAIGFWLLAVSLDKLILGGLPSASDQDKLEYAYYLSVFACLILAPGAAVGWALGTAGKHVLGIGDELRIWSGRVYMWSMVAGLVASAIIGVAYAFDTLASFRAA